jgi:hypothetical protein
MKKRWSWSLFNLGDAIPAQAVKLQNIWMGVATALCTTNYFTANSDYTVYMMAFAGVVNALLGCFKIEE